MKPKILLITLNSCYPLFHGGAVAQYYFIDGLKDQVQFVLCTEVKTEKELKHIEQLKQKQPSLIVYTLNSIRPLPKNDFRSFLKKIIVPKKKHNLILQPNSDDFADPYFEHADNKHSEAFIRLINEIIVKESITQVQFDFYNTIDLCWGVPGDIRKIFVHHELRFKRLQLAYEKSSLSPACKNYLIQKTELFERACLREMDEVIVFNENDADLLRSDCKSVTVSPFGIPDEQIFKNQVSDTFDKLLFVGGEGHTPNLLGLTWFLDEIYTSNMKEIRYPVWIIGDWSENVKNKYSMYSQVVFCGVVDSVEPYFEHSIFVNPILTGAGLRTKVIHAMVNKVPVLTTRFGAEGCFSENEDKHIGLFEDADEFITVLQKSDFKSLAINGYDFYNSLFSKKKLLQKRLDILTNIINA